MRLRVVLPAVAHRTVVRYFFLAVAIVCLGLYGYAYLERVVYQAYESREFDRTLDRSAAAVAVHQIDPGSPIGARRKRRIVRGSSLRLRSSDDSRFHDCICLRWCVKASTETRYSSPWATFLRRHCPGKPETSAWRATATRSFAG